MPAIERVMQDGRYWYPVGSAARRLATTATKIRALMGAGVLEWCQKGNSRILLVSVESLEAYRLSPANPRAGALSAALRSPDPLARRSADLPKLGDRDREVEEARRSDIFTRTWEPGTGREK
ncbi:MAG: hypothetical protein EOP94_02700 [Zymomonas sp.]|nr:MAG: hypothetical protein EOP94_02700 [Zymomonas sp.]